MAKITKARKQAITKFIEQQITEKNKLTAFDWDDIPYCDILDLLEDMVKVANELLCMGGK